MPLERQNVIQFALLLILVPAQYVIVSYFGSTQTQKDDQLNQIISFVSSYKTRFFTLDSWRQWCLKVLTGAALFGSKLSTSSYVEKFQADEGESPAIEVLKYREPKGYFAGSSAPRSPRPAHVKYRIGQVIKHKRHGYRGVIIGWDPITMAPDYWIKQMYPTDKQHLVQFPSYSVLVDTRDRTRAQKTYVAEENIEIISGTRIIHPDLDDSFESFDGFRYIPRPRLKALYPHD